MWPGGGGGLSPGAPRRGAAALRPHGAIPGRLGGGPARARLQPGGDRGGRRDRVPGRLRPLHPPRAARRAQVNTYIQGVGLLLGEEVIHYIGIPQKEIGIQYEI